MSKKDGSKKTALKTNRNKRDLPATPASVPAERPKKQLSEGSTQTVEKSIHSSAPSTKINGDSKSDRSCVKNAEKTVPKKKRKPVIRTITSKNGPVRIFKAVHFVDQHNTTPLEIKIPAPAIKKQQKISKYTETTSLKFKPKVIVSKNSSPKPSTTEKLSKLAAVRKRAEKRRERSFKQGTQPSCNTHLKEPPSPPTEVARWAPSSADPETIPYYEAWINTTLAAISKNPEQDKLAYEKRQAELLRSFEKILDERPPPSPELFYANCADEKYTGKIRFRQKDKRKKQQV
ncbi:hypothetical protein PYW07_012584 [Mythimna separata]|uniref:Uncharacterized protein n=1 Tax=Mythimna separata TaxID=271217 RepID=A0AAD8DLD7_MYTSE|nr:hypothetical protein PYW07_012584 [Mythimna separata]